MPVTSIGRVRSRTAATGRVLGAAAAVLALAGGCAQPGQLGHDDAPTPAPEPGGTGVPPDPAARPLGAPPAGAPGVPGAPAATAGSDVQGTVERPVRISTRGPAEFLVRTEVLAPGQSTGWVVHPGTVISVVRSGTVTVVRERACEPARFGANQGFFLGDGEAGEVRNDGPDAAVLTRSELLSPGADERRPAGAACPAS